MPSLCSQFFLILASFSLFVDQPFKIGDTVQLGSLTGCVEFVGFKTTKIRSLSGELILIPNDQLTRATLLNLERAEHYVKSFELGVDCGTADEILEQIPEHITAVIDEIEGVEPDQVYFKYFGDFSLVFEIRYRVLGNSMAEQRRVLNLINLGINKKFKEVGINMPFPTRSIRTTNIPSE